MRNALERATASLMQTVSPQAVCNCPRISSIVRTSDGHIGRQEMQESTAGQTGAAYFSMTSARRKSIAMAAIAPAMNTSAARPCGVLLRVIDTAVQ